MRNKSLLDRGGVWEKAGTVPSSPTWIASYPRPIF